MARPHDAAVPRRPRRQPAAPPELLDARARTRCGAIDAAALRARRGRRDPRRRRACSEDVGLQAVTDGEFRRNVLAHGLHLRSSTASPRPTATSRSQFHNAHGDLEFTPPALHVDGKVGVSTRRSSATTSRSCGVAPATARAEADDPVAEHDPLPRRAGRDRRGASTPTSTTFWNDLAAAYREEIAGSTRSAAPTSSSTTRASRTSTTRSSASSSRAIGGDPDAPARRATSGTINEVLAGRPAGMTRHDAHVPRQLPLVLGGRGRLRATSPRRCSASSTSTASSSSSTTSARAASSRCASSRTGKQVVLGLVTTKSGELESKDDLKRRIDEASSYVPLDQLCLSPQCGFSSTVEGNALSHDEQVAKLALIVEVADEVWGR